MAGLRRWRKLAASAASNSNEDAEKGPQLHSRLDKILNMPQGVCLRFCFPVALLADLFEHPQYITYRERSGTSCV